jgi:chromate transporter
MPRTEGFVEREFLRDVLQLALSAFGGPQAHIALMFDIMVERRKYLTEQELLELNALCQFLPGPTSTQTLTAIGLKLGGQRLALLTLAVWIIPACLLMSMIGFLIVYFAQEGFQLELLRFIRPIAVGFILVAAWRLSKTFLQGAVDYGIMALSVVLSLVFTNSFTFPAVLVLGALIANFTNRLPLEKMAYDLRKIRWRNFYLFSIILLLAVIIGNVFQNKAVLFFENIYRFGSLVFGGGQVLIPMMFEQFVSVKAFMTADQFLTGYGLAQAIPGPVFSFASFLGTMSFQEAGYPAMLLGAVLGGIGIFLPGTLLIFFIYPAWEELKKMRAVRKALTGINAAATGLVFAAAVILMQPIGFSSLNFVLVGLTFALLHKLRIPPLLIVCLGIIAGVMLS